MDYIPDFIDRKQGIKPIEYDLPEMEEYLAETYGVTVYQEQVMLLSRKLASFTKGEADKLRKAMGKKQIAVMMELKDKFMKQGMANGHPEKTLDKIWKDWEKFAQYAFNKSHATCYAWVSYQTAWLKCHYPSEFFAANLSCNLDKADEIKKIMGDCMSHKINVLTPDVNESVSHFSVNRKGDIRFGLGGIKGFGSNVVDVILAERAAHGEYKDVYDFVERVPVVNRRALECLVYAGALDSFGYKRTQFFLPGTSGDLFIDELARYADLYRRDTVDASSSLFGDVEEMKPVRPVMPSPPEEENVLTLLQKEKELVGTYISSHPLDRYRFEIEQFTTGELLGLETLIEECDRTRKPRKVSYAGIVTDVKDLTARNGKPFGRVTLEDFSGPYEISLFSKDYEAFRPKIQLHTSILVKGEIRERYVVKQEDRAQGKTAPYEFKVSDVSLLGNVTESALSAITLNVMAGQIDAAFRKELVKLLQSYKGEIPLKLYIVDPKLDYKIEFKSKKYKVRVCTEFIYDLDRLGIPYTITRK